MITLGCTGHQALSPLTRRRIKAIFASRIAKLNDNPTGLCSLAIGADQIFAQALLENGGNLHAVIPCKNYADTFDEYEDLQTFQRLIYKAYEVTELSFSEPSEEAFMAAGRTVAEGCDLLFAVWDGQPAAGLGGTADVVAHAKDLGRDIEIIWPSGSSGS